MELLVIFVAPTWENGMIVPYNTILGCSRIYRDQYWYNSQPLGIYGDPAYSFSIHLQAIFSWQNLTPNPVNLLQGNESNSSFRRMPVWRNKNFLQVRIIKIINEGRIKCSWQNLLYMCLHNARTCFIRIKLSSFQFICVDLVALFFYIIMYKRKKVLHTNIYIFSSSPDSGKCKKKVFLKEWNLGHIEDFLQNFNEVPRSWQFSEKLFTVTEGVL